MGLRLRLNDKTVTRFLFAVQGVGAVFVGLFLAAYLGGLPTTAVLHSELAFRIPLFIFGAALLALIIAGCIFAIFKKE